MITLSNKTIKLLCINYVLATLCVENNLCSSNNCYEFF